MKLHRIFTLASAMLAATCIAVAGPLASTYQAVACDGIYAPCDFVGAERSPTSHDTAGLTSDLFRSFFEHKGILRGMPGNITWEAEGSNDNGYVFGSVQGPNMIRTQFLYREGELLCCTTDEPFFLSAINDNNILVGGFATAPGPFIAYAGFDADKRKIPLNIIPDPRVPLNNWLLYGYTAIDSHNNILAKGPGQTFVLDPVFHPRMSQDRAAQ